MIARQIIKQLGGLSGLELLASEGLIKLLMDMQDNKTKELIGLLKRSDIENYSKLIKSVNDLQVGRVINKKDFMGRMGQIAQSREYKSNAVKILERCIEHKMFRLGVILKCPVCVHNSWHGIDKLNYKIQCPHCLDVFKIPTHSPDNINWAYRTFGPFSLQGGAEGAYTTLLALRLFSKTFNFATTPYLSFNTKIVGKDKEIDLGLLIKESKHRREEDIRAVFVECKSYNDFLQSDIKKMDDLAKRFPGATIVFATLKNKLSEKEKRLLKPLVNRCRKYWKNDEPYNPVLILTKIELFASHGLSYAWNKVGGEHKKMSIRNFDDKLLYTCDATQQLYLGMKPWQEEVYKNLARVSKKNLAKSPSDQAS